MYDNTILELRFEGISSGATPIVEETGKTVTNNGIDVNDTHYVRGDSAGLSSFEYLSVSDLNNDLDIGKSDFTFQTWIRPTSITYDNYLFDFRQNSGDIAPSLRIDRVTDKLTFDIAGVKLLESTTVFATSTWYHIAIIRKNCYTKLYVNGICEDESLDENDYIDVDSVYIGCNYNISKRSFFYLNEFIFYNIALYQQNFSEFLQWEIVKYNRTSYSYYNKRDIDRILNDMDFLIDFIKDSMGVERILPNSISAIDKKTFGRAQLINLIEENINNIKDYLPEAPSGWNDLYMLWEANKYDFLHTNANNLEENLYLIYNDLKDIYTSMIKYRTGSNRAICGAGWPLFS